MLEILQALPFFLCAIAHTYLLLLQMEMASSRIAAVPEIQWPIIAVLIGCVIDNCRLALGSILGAQPISRFLAQTAYFFHLVLLPSLFISMACFIQRIFFYNEGVTNTVMAMGFILATVFSLDGLNIFYSKVCYNLILDDSTGIAKYTINPTQKGLALFLPRVLITLTGIVVGTAFVIKYNQPAFLVVQVIAFVGQALSPLFKTAFFYTMAFLEAVYLASLRPAHFLLPVIVLSLLLVLVGALWWSKTGESRMFWLQLLCLIGQGVSPALFNKKWLMQAMNPYEVFVMWGVISLASSLISKTV